MNQIGDIGAKQLVFALKNNEVMKIFVFIYLSLNYFDCCTQILKKLLLGNNNISIELQNCLEIADAKFCFEDDDTIHFDV